MANDNEVLIKVEVDQSAALADLTQTETAITDIEQAQENLNNSLKQGKVTTDQYKTSRQSLDNQLNTAKASHKNLTDSLNANNKTLGDGAVKTKGLGKEVTGLGKEIGTTKKATDAFGGGLDQYAKGLDSFGVGASGAIDKVKGLTAASLQFLATPVGAIIGVIVLALGSLASYFKNTGDGADKFARIMAQVGAAMDVVTDRVSNFGRGLADLFTGDVEAGLFQMAQAFKGVGDEMVNEVKSAGEVEDALDALGDAELTYQTKASQTRNEIKLLEIQAKDRTKTEGERAALLQQALDKEIQLNNDLKEIRRGQLEQTVEEVAARSDLQRQNNESLEDFAMRLVEDGKLTDDLREKVSAGIKALNDAEGESLNNQEKIQNKRNELLDKQKDRQDKDLEATIKRLKDESVASRDEIQKQYDERERIENEAALKQKQLHDRSFVDFAEFQAALTKQQAAAEDERTSLQKFGAEARKVIQSQEFKDFGAALEGSMQFVESIYEQAISAREAQAKAEIDIVTLQMQAEKAITEQKYEDDLAALQKRFEDGEISQDEYNAAREDLDKRYKDAQTAIEQQAAYEKDQIQRKAFEDNKKIRVADSIIDAIQASIAAFRSLAGIPFVGPVLGAVAAAAALKFGMDNVQRIRDQQYVGSGAQPPAPPSGRDGGGGGGFPPIAQLPPPVFGGDTQGDIDGGGVARQLSGEIPQGPAPQIFVVASWKEFTDLDNSIKFKEGLAEV